ncbi:DeoR/GlpR family DNA-binding transcription regulator [Aeromicrobium chenweiae]|uniref:Lactose phosphotransferase system repressor n=1 Tax=Aeromicrobium chenweiae TaxID=2079793 RepID=A0A2S0WK36_9ACTN|nr:DeoR/GlpR family DNA-binding transcription regulator [Aeromicrobium chenweiae]AWB91703.1 D-beta-D-heptose 1-phosphate adenosyltransferase [Aeromicrobium chenweiae]TGN32544.1 DeoR/GlpR transcriptional regulator [Aeromicrobium chenweiae]
MYAAERQQLLVERLHLDGRLVVIDLADELGVSSETIRRDLAVLERDGLAQRVHGGAVAARALTILEPGLAQRTSTNAAEKERIAREAAVFLPEPGGSMVLDAGTTISHLVDLIPLDQPYTVLTHAIPTASKLTAIPSVSLHLLGGRVRGVTAAAVGQSTVDALAAVQVDVCFLATNAASPTHGLSTPDVEEAAVKRALARSARRVVAVFDSSKFSVEHVFSFASYDDLDVVVTDKNARDEDVQAIRARGVEVVLA